MILKRQTYKLMLFRLYTGPVDGILPGPTDSLIRHQHRPAPASPHHLPPPLTDAPRVLHSDAMLVLEARSPAKRELDYLCTHDDSCHVEHLKAGQSDDVIRIKCGYVS